MPRYSLAKRERKTCNNFKSVIGYIFYFYFFKIKITLTLDATTPIILSPLFSSYMTKKSFMCQGAKSVINFFRF